MQNEWRRRIEEQIQLLDGHYNGVCVCVCDGWDSEAAASQV